MKYSIDTCVISEFRKPLVIDGLLAATSQENNFVFVTRNVKDFIATGIQILNPWVEK